MKVGTPSSELRVAIAGALVLTSAAGVVVLESPHPRTRPEPAPVQSRASRTAAEPTPERVGPLVVGDELALGFRITRLTFDSDAAIRVELVAADTRRVAIGVSSKHEKLERPLAVEFPNIALWYVGRGAIPAEYPELAKALAALLDRAASPRSASDVLHEWKAAAQDGG